MELDTIYNQDCSDGMKSIQDESIDLILTDCPYKIVSGGCTNNAVKIGNGNREQIKQGKVFKHNDIEFKDWLPDIYRILKNNSHCYIMINGRNLADLQKESEKVGFIYQNLLVWDKGNATPNKWYMNNCEFILMLRKGKAKNINYLGSTTLLRINNIAKGKKLHPTEKPVDLMKILIENSTLKDQIVLDPFIGSGTTAIACIDTGRHYIGYEMDPEYYKIANNRILDYELGYIE